MKITLRRKIPKKGMDGSQLSWIFMLVSGVVILLFFFFVVQKQRALSKEALAEKILVNLQGLFTGASVSSGATNYFETPLVRFDFTCDRETCTQYGCGDSSFSMPEYSGASKPVNTQPLFSPTSIKSNGMTVITKPWNVPFKPVNFVYITNPSVAYVVVYNSNSAALAMQIHDDVLPEKEVRQDNKPRKLIVKYNLDYTDPDFEKIIKAMTQERIKIIDTTGVALSGNSINLFSSDTAVIEGISMTPNVRIKEYGQIDFYKFSKSNLQWKKEGTSYYLGEASFVGAIFAEDMNNYECNMIKAYATLSQISKLYESRRVILEKAAKDSDSQACEAVYKQAKESLQPLSQLNWPLENKVAEINDYGKELKSSNDLLERRSCALIY